jgi:hypothetical protein
VGFNTFVGANAGYPGFDGSGDAFAQNNSAVATTGISVSNSTTGVSGTNANLQPYITVYFWKRTA